MPPKHEDYECKCGIPNYRQDSPTDPELRMGEMPWHILLVSGFNHNHTESSDIRDGINRCSGALISRRHIMTSGGHSWLFFPLNFYSNWVR